MSYANCGLPYYIGGAITDREELTLQTPESFWQRFRVDVRVRHEVTAIHPAEKTVTVKDLTLERSLTSPMTSCSSPPAPAPPSRPCPVRGWAGSSPSAPWRTR